MVMAEFGSCNTDSQTSHIFFTVISVIYFTLRAVCLYTEPKSFTKQYSHNDNVFYCVLLNSTSFKNHIYNVTSDSDPLMTATHSSKKLIWMGFLNLGYIINHLGSS